MTAQEARVNTLWNILPKQITDSINTAVKHGNYSVKIDKTDKIDNFVGLDITLVELGYKVQDMLYYYKVSW